MKWLLKAATQKALSALPRGEELNFLLQYRVTKSLPQGDAAFRRKVERAIQHYAAFAEHAPPEVTEPTFYEFGAGWDLVVPLAYFALGVPAQILTDIRPNVRFELLNDSVRRFDRLQPELEASAGRALRGLGGPGIRSIAELAQRFGIDYRAPVDARATGLPEACADFVSSTNTLEHVPAGDIVPILAECLRLLRPGGVLSCRIDMRDHRAYFDRSQSVYGFLTVSDRAWSLVNSSLQFQNRLRRSDYLRMLAEAGFELVAQRSAPPTAEELEHLRRARLAPRFRGYELEDLGAKSLAVVARRPLPAHAPR
jgi:SAM-dependent methyltransferase